MDVKAGKKFNETIGKQRPKSVKLEARSNKTQAVAKILGRLRFTMTNLYMNLLFVYLFFSQLYTRIL